MCRRDAWPFVFTFSATGTKLTGLPSPRDNVHETGVSPGGQSRSPIVAAEARQVEPTRTKTWSRARSEVLCPIGSGRKDVAIDEPVPRDNFASPARDGLAVYGGVPDECMELSVLATRVHSPRKVL
jgi:hypothetical protein